MLPELRVAKARTSRKESPPDCFLRAPGFELKRIPESSTEPSLGVSSSPDAASKCEVDNVRRRRPPQRSTAATESEPAAMQRTRVQRLDGVGFQERPRTRSASGGDRGLLQHGHGSPEAESAAVQLARAKLLEPEDGVDFQPPRLRRQSRSDGDLLAYGRRSPIDPPTRFAREVAFARQARVRRESRASQPGREGRQTRKRESGAQPLTALTTPLSNVWNDSGSEVDGVPDFALWGLLLVVFQLSFVLLFIADRIFCLQNHLPSRHGPQ